MNNPKTITYKDVMIVYGLAIHSAKHKLNIIRNELGKKRHQSVLVAEFCYAEGVDVVLFEQQLQKETTALHQPKQLQQGILNLT